MWLALEAQVLLEFTPKTTVKNKSGTHEFPCYSVGESLGKADDTSSVCAEIWSPAHLLTSSTAHLMTSPDSSREGIKGGPGRENANSLWVLPSARILSPAPNPAAAAAAAEANISSVVLSGEGSYTDSWVPLARSSCLTASIPFLVPGVEDIQLYGRKEEQGHPSSGILEGYTPPLFLLLLYPCCSHGGAFAGRVPINYAVATPPNSLPSDYATT